jgi:hypothetical protein
MYFIKSYHAITVPQTNYFSCLRNNISPFAFYKCQLKRGQKHCFCWHFSQNNDVVNGKRPFFIGNYKKRCLKQHQLDIYNKINTMKRTLIIRPETAKKILELPVRNPIKLTVATADKILIEPKKK